MQAPSTDDWTQREIVAQIEQTAERSVPGHDRLVGWGVVDPVRALTEDDHPIEEPVAHEGVTRAEAPTPAKLHLGETQAERSARMATYMIVGTAVMVAGLAGRPLPYGTHARGSRGSGDWGDSEGDLTPLGVL